MNPHLLIVLVVWGLLMVGCGYRGSSTDMEAIPVIASIAQAIADENKPPHGRSTEQILADLESIPREIEDAIDHSGIIEAESMDGLLDTLKLAPYRSLLVIVGIGDPFSPDYLVYYKKDKYVMYRFDAIKQRIVGPIRVVRVSP